VAAREPLQEREDPPLVPFDEQRERGAVAVHRPGDELPVGGGGAADRGCSRWVGVRDHVRLP
jgi:hypothetical protein